MPAKMKALDELAKKMNELKSDKFKSRKSKMAEEVVCEDEECEDESHDHKKPELEIEIIELGTEEEPEEEEEEEGGKKSFSQILADVAKNKGKKH